MNGGAVSVLIKIVAALPAAVFARILLYWDPKSGKQWLCAAAMAAYMAAYYLIFVR